MVGRLTPKLEARAWKDARVSLKEKAPHMFRHAPEGRSMQASACSASILPSALRVKGRRKISGDPPFQSLASRTATQFLRELPCGREQASGIIIDRLGQGG